jgi:hypothetical protein
MYSILETLTNAVSTNRDIANVLMFERTSLSFGCIVFEVTALGSALLPLFLFD